VVPATLSPPVRKIATDWKAARSKPAFADGGDPAGREPKRGGGGRPTGTLGTQASSDVRRSLCANRLLHEVVTAIGLIRCDASRFEQACIFSISGNRIYFAIRGLCSLLGTKDSASRLEGCFAFLIIITCLEFDNAKVRRLCGSFGLRICQQCQRPSSLPTSSLPKSSFA
jgi:hypothetical protein